MVDGGVALEKQRAYSEPDNGSAVAFGTVALLPDFGPRTLRVDWWPHCVYGTGMKTTLIPIGNSRGIRIPKPLIEQCGLTEEIQMDVRGRAIVIHSPRHARAGWAVAFKQMARTGDDMLLDPQPVSTRWDKEDWEWK